jgi:hypothetical protein
MHLLNAIIQHATSEHFCSQSFPIGQCIHDTFVREFSCNKFNHP